MPYGKLEYPLVTVLILFQGRVGEQKYGESGKHGSIAFRRNLNVSTFIRSPRICLAHKITVANLAYVRYDTMRSWCLCCQEGNKEGRFHTFLRRGYVLLLTHTLTVENKITLIHQTVIML